MLTWNVTSSVLCAWGDLGHKGSDASDHRWLGIYATSVNCVEEKQQLASVEMHEVI